MDTFFTFECFELVNLTADPAGPLGPLATPAALPRGFCAYYCPAQFEGRPPDFFMLDLLLLPACSFEERRLTFLSICLHLSVSCLYLTAYSLMISPKDCTLSAIRRVTRSSKACNWESYYFSMRLYLKLFGVLWPDLASLEADFKSLLVELSSWSL